MNARSRVSGCDQFLLDSPRRSDHGIGLTAPIADPPATNRAGLPLAIPFGAAGFCAEGNGNSTTDRGEGRVGFLPETRDMNQVHTIAVRPQPARDGLHPADRAPARSGRRRQPHQPEIAERGLPRPKRRPSSRQNGDFVAAIGQLGSQVGQIPGCVVDHRPEPPRKEHQPKRLHVEESSAAPLISWGSSAAT